MRVLLPAEKAIYDHWLKEIVKPKNIHYVPYKSCMACKTPEGFDKW